MLSYLNILELYDLYIYIMNFNYSVCEKVVQINGIIEIKITTHFLINNIDFNEKKIYAFFYTPYKYLCFPAQKRLSHRL